MSEKFCFVVNDMSCMKNGRVSVSLRLIRISGDADHRSAALANILAVRCRECRAVLPVEFAVAETGDRLALPGPPDQAVIEKRRREHVGGADRRHLGAQLAVPDAPAGRAQRRAAPGAERRVAPYQRRS